MSIWKCGSVEVRKCVTQNLRLAPTPSQLIKESKESKCLIFFDFLINSKVIHTSYLNEGQ